MARPTKAPAKKAVKKAVSPKTVAKKTPTKATAKKASPKKAAPKQSTPKKAASKKAPAKKAPVKKATPKKPAPAKTPAPTKSAAKKAAPAKPAVPTTSAAEKAAPAKAVAKKAAPAKKVAAKKAAPKKPAKSPYDAKFLEVQREALVEERRKLSKEVTTLDAEATELANLREPGDVQFDEESGEGDTLQVERERDLALSAQFRAHIDDIDHALAKITANTYGLCEASGLAIPKERLRAIPWARERVEYKVGGFRR